MGMSNDQRYLFSNGSIPFRVGVGRNPSQSPAGGEGDKQRSTLFLPMVFCVQVGSWSLIEIGEAEVTSHEEWRDRVEKAETSGEVCKVSGELRSVYRNWNQARARTIQEKSRARPRTGTEKHMVHRYSSRKRVSKIGPSGARYVCTCRESRSRAAEIEKGVMVCTRVAEPSGLCLGRVGVWRILDTTVRSHAHPRPPELVGELDPREVATACTSSVLVLPIINSRPLLF